LCYVGKGASRVCNEKISLLDGNFRQGMLASAPLFSTTLHHSHSRLAQSCASLPIFMFYVFRSSLLGGLVGQLSFFYDFDCSFGVIGH
jgi:hypothetical protein